MKCAPTQQFRNVEAPVDLGGCQIAQCANTKGSRCSLRFSSAQVIIATDKLALLARLHDDQGERSRKRDGPNLFAARIEEDGVLSATEQRDYLVEQPGLNAYVKMLCALAGLRDFKARQVKREEFQQEQCSSKLKCCRARQSGANRQIAAYMSGKTLNRNIEVS